MRWNFLIGAYPFPTVDVDAIDPNYRTFQIATAQDQNVFPGKIFRGNSFQNFPKIFPNISLQKYFKM
jgi:hypothetical protein